MGLDRPPHRVVLLAAVLSLPMAAAIADPGDGQPASQPAPQPGSQPVTPPKSTPMIGFGGGGMTPAAPAKPKKERKEDNGDGKAQTTLTMDAKKFDFAARKAAGMMSMPSMAKLSETRPAGVTREPSYQGKPRYATLTIGTGTPNQFVIAFDEAAGKAPKVYLDLNGDGDLTNDGTGEWGSVGKKPDGSVSECQGTWAFNVSWKGGDGAVTHADYGLNMFYAPGREQIGYYPAAARTGKITVNGAEFEVTLVENDGDGRFDKLYDPRKPEIFGEAMPKPVYLYLDSDYFDIRETFAFDDMNYIATVSDDGANLKLTPTAKTIRLPRDTDRPELLSRGTEAPDFEAILWKPGQTQFDRKQTFKLSDYRGKKIVVVDMWATYCVPCMAGIPHMSKIAEAVAGQDVVVIAMNVFEDEKAFSGFATGKGKDYKFMLAHDPAGRGSEKSVFRNQYKVKGIPCTYIIDKSGKVAAVISGYASGDTKVEAALRGLGVKVD